MRITFVLPTVNLSGGIRVAAIYAKQLAARAHTVRVVSPPPREPSIRSRIKSVLKGEGWPTVEQPRSHLDGSGIDHHVLERWRPVTDADVPDADVVIATWWETAEWVAALSPRKGAKVYFVQGHEVFPYLPPRSRETYHLPLHKIVVARWLADIMREEYGDSCVDIVPNSVDQSRFFAVPRAKQPIPTVGFIYAREPLKGTALVLTALESIRQRHPTLKIIAFGAHQPTNDLPLPPGVEFHLAPPQDSIRDLYAACDVWVCGSYSEGFHLPPLEAMACRTPVVSTAVGGPTDVIIHGVNGYLVPVGDAQALGDHIERILSLDDERWCVMSVASHNRATAYTWDDATTLFETALQRARNRAEETSHVKVSLQQ